MTHGYRSLLKRLERQNPGAIERGRRAGMGFESHHQVVPYNRDFLEVLEANIPGAVKHGEAVLMWPRDGYAVGAIQFVPEYVQIVVFQATSEKHYEALASKEPHQLISMWITSHDNMSTHVDDLLMATAKVHHYLQSNPRNPRPENEDGDHRTAD